MTKKEALQILKILSAAYPNQKLPEDSVEIYCHAIKDLDFDTTRQVAARHIKTQKWFPSISELYNADCLQYPLPGRKQIDAPAIGHRGSWSFLDDDDNALSMPEEDVSD